MPPSNSPVTSVSSTDIRCNVGGATGISGKKCPVVAGQTVTVEMHAVFRLKFLDIKSRTDMVKYRSNPVIVRVVRKLLEAHIMGQSLCISAKWMTRPPQTGREVGSRSSRILGRRYVKSRKAP